MLVQNKDYFQYYSEQLYKVEQQSKSLLQDLVYYSRVLYVNL